jgi:sugar lactone lactonase YvrE
MPVNWSHESRNRRKTIPQVRHAALSAIAAVTGVLAVSPATAQAQAWLDLAVGEVGTLAGPIEAGSGGLEVDAEGHVYHSDFGRTLSSGPMGTRVFRITPAGEVSVFAEGFNGASGSTIDAQGRFVQANVAGNTISRVDPDGSVETIAEGGLANPVGVTYDLEGRLVVANCGAHQLVRVGEGGRAEVFAEGDLFRCPNGLVTGADGMFYVSNFYDGNVLRITPQGEVSVVATLPGGNLGHLVYHDDRLYVIARSAHQIYEVELDGAFRLLVGSGDHGIDDGPALEATLSFPNDLAFSPDGRVLYWNDVAAIVEDGGQTLAPVVIRMLRLR